LAKLRATVPLEWECRAAAQFEQRGVGLGNVVTRSAFDKGDVSAVDETVEIDVFPEYRSSRGRSVARLCLGLTDISTIDTAVRIGVAKQYAHWHREIAGNGGDGNTSECHTDCLLVRHAGAIDNDVVSGGTRCRRFPIAGRRTDGRRRGERYLHLM